MRKQDLVGNTVLLGKLKATGEKGTLNKRGINSIKESMVLSFQEVSKADEKRTFWWLFSSFPYVRSNLRAHNNSREEMTVGQRVDMGAYTTISTPCFMAHRQKNV